MCSYFFVSVAYGILMEESGFAWYYSLLVSLTVYTGAFQFVLTTLLSAGASIVTIAVTAFFMNSTKINCFCVIALTIDNSDEVWG